MSLEEEKESLRVASLAARRAVDHRRERSIAACNYIVNGDSKLPPVVRTATICWYVSFRDEVDTHDAIVRNLDSSVVVVPFCEGDKLGLWRLAAFGELMPGAWGILEPPPERRVDSRILAPSALDVVILPGLAFDTAGARLGYGRGYYDRLLSEVRPDVVRLGLCFSCQVFDVVPSTICDQIVDYLVTEDGVIACEPNS